MTLPWAKRPTSQTLPTKIAGWAAVAFVASCSAMRAGDLPGPLTIDLPMPANQATPLWLGHPETPKSSDGMSSTLNLPILTTPDSEASLAVTVYFTEKQGNYLRVSWQGTQGSSEILSDNFYEGVDMQNQRTILLAPAMLEGDGTLTFLSGNVDLGISRIKLEWLATKPALVSPTVKNVLVTTANGVTQASTNLNGQPASPDAGMWQNQVVNVPLADAPARIEQGVDFSVDLDKVPTLARLGLKESGLPLGRHLVVWINEKYAGTISPSVPDLADGGFTGDASNNASYVGWRDGSFYIPSSLLHTGMNTVQFSDASDTNQQESPSAQPAPLAVKGLSLQLSYAPLQPQGGITLPEAAPASPESVEPVDAAVSITPVAPSSDDPLPLTAQP